MNRPPMKHTLKVMGKAYEDIKEGQQDFLIQFDEHDFQVGDILTIQEHKRETSHRGDPTGEEITRRIKFAIRICQGLQRGHVAIGLGEVK